jgi:hypothetical protein
LVQKSGADWGRTHLALAQASDHNHNSSLAIDQFATIVSPETMLRRLRKLVPNKTDREILTWFGGGVVVVVSGIWALIAYVFPHDDKRLAAPTVAIVNPSGPVIAPARDANFNGPVTFGLDEKKNGEQIAAAQKPLEDRLERILAITAREKGVEIAPLRAILLKLGEAGVRDDDIAKRLDEKADELIKLREETAKLRQGPPELASFAQQAQTLIDKGEFDGARAVLAAGRAAARNVREQSSRYEAKFLAQEAKVDHLQLAYRSAATKYAEAARLVTGFDQPQVWEFLLAQAGELRSQGDEFGDNQALIESVSVYRSGVLLAPRSQQPLDWAMTQMNLGIALWTLGGRESGTARLEEAVAAYRAALEEMTRARVPLDWAVSTGNQGVALKVIAERRGDLAMAEQALAQITAAFETCRDAHHAPNAAYYEAQLPASRALVGRLRKG